MLPQYISMIIGNFTQISITTAKLSTNESFLPSNFRVFILQLIKFRLRLSTLIVHSVIVIIYVKVSIAIKNYALCTWDYLLLLVLLLQLLSRLFYQLLAKFMKVIWKSLHNSSPHSLWYTLCSYQLVI